MRTHTYCIQHHVNQEWHSISCVQLNSPTASTHSLFPFFEAIDSRVSSEVRVCTGDSWTIKSRHQFHECILKNRKVALKHTFKNLITFVALNGVRQSNTSLLFFPISKSISSHSLPHSLLAYILSWIPIMSWPVLRVLGQPSCHWVCPRTAQSSAISPHSHLSSSDELCMWQV